MKQSLAAALIALALMCGCAKRAPMVEFRLFGISEQVGTVKKIYNWTGKTCLIRSQSGKKINGRQTYIVQPRYTAVLFYDGKSWEATTDSRFCDVEWTPMFCTELLSSHQKPIDPTYWTPEPRR